MRKVVHFDSFYTVCPWFDGGVDVNNGYGCNHPQQEETDFDETLGKQGMCFCCSCPLGLIADKESVADPNVDWSDISDDRNDIEIESDYDSDYLIVNYGEDATEDEKKVYAAYCRYMNRYDSTRKEK